MRDIEKLSFVTLRHKSCNLKDKLAPLVHECFENVGGGAAFFAKIAHEANGTS